jgi:hypothetical protein
MARLMKRQARDDLVAAAVIALAVIGSIIGSRFYTFRLFFSWPAGGTWSNTLAWLEDAALAFFAVWYFRDHVGKHLAAWWRNHNVKHVDEAAAKMREHVSGEISAMEDRLRAAMLDQHKKIMRAVNDSALSGAQLDQDERSDSK